MLKEGLLKENIDGEAISWAFNRIKKRIYDKEEILLNFRDDKKDTLLWNSGRGKNKQSSLGLNTLRNRITELRKAGLIE